MTSLKTKYKLHPIDVIIAVLVIILLVTSIVVAILDHGVEQGAPFFG